MAKTLITGATGGLGSTVAAFLKEKKGTENVAVLVRDGNSDKAKQYREQGFEVRVADYEEQETLVNAFTGISVLYFVSGNDIEARKGQHRNVVSAAKEAGIKHILYTSTVRKDESQAAPLYPVVNGHAQTEERIKESGIAYTLLRHNLYGEVIPLFAGDKTQLLQSKTIYLPTGDGKTAFVPRKDFAEAEATILINPQPHENKAYEFNGSEAVTFAQVAEILSGITGEHIAYVSPDIREFKNALTASGLPAGIVGMLSMFSHGIANGEFDRLTDDLEHILGRKTQPIADYLKEVYA